jgi:3-oxoacyl-[acyl-carrier-protein] synthase II
MTEMRRVAITGIGLLTPLGVGTGETWEALLEGASAVGPISAYDASSLRTQVGAEIGELNARQYMRNRRSLRTMTRYDVMTVVAATLAARDAGLEFADDPEGRVGLFCASGKEISEPEHFEQVAVDVRDEDGTVDMQRFGEASSEVHPLFFVEGLQGASLFYISENQGTRGASTYFAGTAEASAIAVGRAFRAVRRGEADIALAGGGDAPVCWWNMAKIDSLGVLSCRNDLGAGACRPFDIDRDGTVMGEGGAFLVLEPLDDARRRGAEVYAEVTGFGSAIDTYAHVTPEPSGRPLAHAIASALREAGCRPEDLDYIAAHGSGTRAGDASEGAALRSLFGNASRPLGSSVKPATGHLGAAAGALNVAVAALAIRHGAVPPSLGLDHVDPVCDGVEWIRDGARDVTPRATLGIARGLEGQNVALALGAA